MRYLYLIVIIFFATQINTKAEDLLTKFAIQAGVKPTFVFFHASSETFHIICSNQDEAPASWWTISAYDLPLSAPTKNINKSNNLLEEWTTVNATKRMDFPYHNTYFFYAPYMTLDNLFMALGDEVIIYDIVTGNQIQNGRYEIEGAHSVSSRGHDMYVCVRIDNDDDFIADVNKVEIYDITTQSKYHTIDAHTNVQQALPMGQDMLAVLSEGVSGDSKVQVFKKVGTSWTNVGELQAGDDANQIYYDRAKLFVTCNGSHEVRVFDINTMQFEYSYTLPTSDWNGPRMSYYSPDERKLAVSSYDGKVYVYDTMNKVLYKEFQADGKLEGIYYNDRFFGSDHMLILAASPYQLDSYDVNTKVYGFFFIPNAGNVDEDYFSDFTISPNPADNHIKYEAKLANNEIGRAKLSILTINGRLISEISQEVAANGSLHGDITLDKGDYPNGSYLMMLEINNRKVVRKFIINR